MHVKQVYGIYLNEVSGGNGSVISELHTLGFQSLPFDLPHHEVIGLRSQDIPDLSGASPACPTRDSPAKRTSFQQWAFFAQRPLGTAQPPTVPDERDVERIDLTRRQHSFQDIVRLVRARVRGDETEALGDTVDVRIDG